MGIASRKKKDRKTQKSALIAPDIGHLLTRSDGGNLILIDGQGVAHGEEEARQFYWTDVCEGIRHRGASCLPEMVVLGRLMQLSIFDVEVPVVEHASGEQINEDIFTAMFLMGHLDCFQWLLGEARRAGCDWALLGRVFRGIVANSARLVDETPHMAMAKMMVRFMAEELHRHGMLEKGMADGGSTMGQPFARRIAQDYLEELTAAAERADLEAVINLEERVAEGGGLRI
jgi:hypothetical protein